MNRKRIIKEYLQILVNYLIPAFLLLSVSFTLFSLAVTTPNQEDVSFSTFDAFSEGVEEFYYFKTAWKPRVLSIALADLTIKIGESILERRPIPMVNNIIQLTIGVWTAGWFVLIGVIFIFMFQKRSSFYIFGIFAGVAFGYLVFYKTLIRVYSWDLPALFVFSLFLVLFLQKKYWWIFMLIPVSIGFKETAFILCFAFIFSDQPWQTRILMAVGSFLLALSVKAGIDAYVHAPFFFTMETETIYETSRELNLIRNINLLLEDVIPLFVNSGLMMAILLVPTLNANIRALKLISIPFVMGIMVFGVVTEYRIWFEMIPFSLYALDVAIYGDPLN